jgi:hypothetical protein
VQTIVPGSHPVRFHTDAPGGPLGHPEISQRMRPIPGGSRQQVHLLQSLYSPVFSPNNQHNHFYCSHQSIVVILKNDSVCKACAAEMIVLVAVLVLQPQMYSSWPRASPIVLQNSRVQQQPYHFFLSFFINPYKLSHELLLSSQMPKDMKLDINVPLQKGIEFVCRRCQLSQPHQRDRQEVAQT